MSIDASGIDMATFFLRDKIYSDKILAVVREYLCNAIDEHQKHKISKPVEISLSSKTFSVRDFALGLSEHDIRNIFGMYFKSTKSSNNNQIGGFGIGSKAGHCYTDTFTVKSFHKGLCTTYICSLGGGKTGVPVGQVLKMAEEETSETGLEISLEINNQDYSVFDARISSFVENSEKNIVYKNIYNKNFIPSKCVRKKDFKDFSIRLYKDDNYRYNNNSVVYKMGDVKYRVFSLSDVWNNNNSYYQNIRVRDHHYLVVDINIGKMSLPISRETFENTEENNKFLEEIRKELTSFVEQDFEKFKNYTTEQIYKDISNMHIYGDFFTLHKELVYGDLYKALNNIGRAGYSSKNKLIFKDKTVVAIIEDKESFSYWVNKFNDHCIKYLDCHTFYINEKHLAKPDILQKLEEIFYFKKIKSTYFKWKRIPKDAEDINTEYKVSFKEGGYGSQSDFYNALELHNKSLARFGIKKVETKEEALESMKKIDFKTEDDLLYFTIHQGLNSYGLRVCTQSKKMVENMKLLGWYESYSDEWNKKVADLREIKRREIEKTTKLNNCRLNILKSSFRFDNKLKRKEKYINKTHTILEKIKNEKSLRAKIFNALNAQHDYSYSSGTLSRKELRQILTIKG